MNRSKQLLQNTMILGIGNILPRIATFINLPILITSLTKSEFGTFDLITNIFSMIIGLATLQISSALFRFLIGEKDINKIKRIVTTALSFILIVSLILAICTYIYFQNFDYYIKLMIASYIGIMTFLSALTQILRGLGKVKEFSINSFISTVFNIFLIIFLLKFLDLALFGVMLALNLTNIASIIYISFNIKLFSLIDFTSISINQFKKLFKYSIAMVPNAFSKWVVDASDRIMIASILGLEATAIYAVARKFPNLITMAQSTFTMAWHESAVLSANDENNDNYYNSIFDNLFRVTVGVAFISLGFMPIIFAILVGDGYANAYEQIPILMLSMLFSGLAMYYGGIYVAKMEVANVAITTITTAIINITINFFFLEVWGIYTASISSLISNIILVIYRGINVQKLQKFTYNWKIIILSLLSLLLVSILFYFDSLVIQLLNGLIAILLAFGINHKLVIKIYIVVLNKFNSK